MKYYDLKGYKVIPYRDHYVDNGSLAVFLKTNKNEDYAVITVNIELSGYIGDEACAYIDTNNCPWVEKFLIKNNIANPTGEIGCSGFCGYPLYRFDLTKLEEYKKDEKEI
jgi:hypothetical protein